MADPTDYFGYSRRVAAPGQVLSSDFAALTFGGDTKQVLLLQSAQVSYGHQVVPFFELGSANLYWATGQASGQAVVGRAVGKEGFLQKFGAGSACSTMRSLSLGIKSTGGCVELTNTGKGFNLLNCVPSQVSVSMQAGALQMQEGMTIMVGTLQPN